MAISDGTFGGFVLVDSTSIYSPLRSVVSAISSLSEP